MSLLKWLVAMIMLRRLLITASFIGRQTILAEVRPRVDGGRIAWPDAVQFITPADVTRAARADIDRIKAARRNRMKMHDNEVDWRAS